MKYIVIYSDGTEQMFYIRGVAEMYARLYDGRISGRNELRNEISNALTMEYI